MNHIWSKVGRASVAAAGVLVATSAASAESRPLQLETEFDLGLDRVAEAAAAPAAVAVDVSPATTAWEAAIGSYLDALVARAEANPGVQATTEVTSEAADAAASDLFVALRLEPAEESAEEPAAKVEAPAAEASTATAKAEAAPNPLLLAPVLSHPATCESCAAAVHDGRNEAEQAAAAAPAAPAEARIDDFAAWQKLAHWAAARAEEDAGDAEADDRAVTAESDFFFAVFAEEDSATE